MPKETNKHDYSNHFSLNSMTVFGLYPGLWQQPIFLWHLQWLEAAVKQKEVKSFSFAFFLSSANGEWCAHLFSWPSTTLVGVTLYINGCQAFLAPKTKAVAAWNLVTSFGQSAVRPWEARFLGPGKSLVAQKRATYAFEWKNLKFQGWSYYTIV